MRQNERLAYEKALELIRAGAVDPESAVANASTVMNLLAVVTPSILGDPIPSRLVVPRSIATVSHSTSAVQTASSWVDIVWPRNGWCIGVCATVGEGAEHRTKIGMGLRVEGVASLITSGTDDAFCPLANLSGGIDMYGHHFMSYRRKVDTSEKWQMRFAPLYPLVSGGPTLYTPLVTFLFESDNEE